MTTQLEPITKPISKAYFADVKAYNNGISRGCWIEFDEFTDSDTVLEQIKTMLSNSPCESSEEWRVDDLEYFAGLSECNNIAIYCAVAALIQAKGENAVEGFIEYIGNTYLDLETLDKFDDCYLGCYESESDFIEQNSGIKEQSDKIDTGYGMLSDFIDWEKLAYSWFIDRYYSYEPHYQECYVYLRS